MHHLNMKILDVWVDIIDLKCVAFSYVWRVEKGDVMGWTTSYPLKKETQNGIDLQD